MITSTFTTLFWCSCLSTLLMSMFCWPLFVSIVGCHKKPKRKRYRIRRTGKSIPTNKPPVQEQAPFTTPPQRNFTTSGIPSIAGGTRNQASPSTAMISAPLQSKDIALGPLKDQKQGPSTANMSKPNPKPTSDKKTPDNNKKELPKPPTMITQGSEDKKETVNNVAHVAKKVDNQQVRLDQLNTAEDKTRTQKAGSVRKNKEEDDDNSDETLRHIKSLSEDAKVPATVEEK